MHPSMVQQLSKRAVSNQIFTGDRVGSCGKTFMLPKTSDSAPNDNDEDSSGIVKTFGGRTFILPQKNTDMTGVEAVEDTSKKADHHSFHTISMAGSIEMINSEPTSSSGEEITGGSNLPMDFYRDHNRSLEEAKACLPEVTSPSTRVGGVMESLVNWFSPPRDSQKEQINSPTDSNHPSNIEMKCQTLSTIPQEIGFSKRVVPENLDVLSTNRGSSFSHDEYMDEPTTGRKRNIEETKSTTSLKPFSHDEYMDEPTTGRKRNIEETKSTNSLTTLNKSDKKPVKTLNRSPDDAKELISEDEKKPAAIKRSPDDAKEPISEDEKKPAAIKRSPGDAKKPVSEDEKKPAAIKRSPGDAKKPPSAFAKGCFQDEEDDEFMDEKTTSTKRTIDDVEDAYSPSNSSAKRIAKSSKKEGDKFMDEKTTGTKRSLEAAEDVNSQRSKRISPSVESYGTSTYCWDDSTIESKKNETENFNTTRNLLFPVSVEQKTMTNLSKLQGPPGDTVDTQVETVSSEDISTGTKSKKKKKKDIYPAEPQRRSKRLSSKSKEVIKMTVRKKTDRQAMNTNAGDGSDKPYGILMEARPEVWETGIKKRK